MLLLSSLLLRTTIGHAILHNAGRPLHYGGRTCLSAVQKSDSSIKGNTEATSELELGLCGNVLSCTASWYVVLDRVVKRVKNASKLHAIICCMHATTTARGSVVGSNFIRF